MQVPPEPEGVALPGGMIGSPPCQSCSFPGPSPCLERSTYFSPLNQELPKLYANLTYPGKRSLTTAANSITLFFSITDFKQDHTLYAKKGSKTYS